ncbi:unnamed protein product [Brassica rapa subsp. narinosa]
MDDTSLIKKALVLIRLSEVQPRYNKTSSYETSWRVETHTKEDRLFLLRNFFLLRKEDRLLAKSVMDPFHQIMDLSFPEMQRFL